MTPAVSIITPTFNRQALLQAQHVHLLAQSEQDFEWLILDDGPEPSAYFQGLSDPRIRYHRNERRMGVAGNTRIALNLTGLLLSKFLARAPEIGVRRALGARRIDVFLQHIVECELVAVVGGAIGVALSLGGLAVVNKWAHTLAQRDNLIQFDATMLGVAVGLSLLAGLVAGVYPAWRVCRTAPAMHLKLQ